MNITPLKIAIKQLLNSLKYILSKAPKDKKLLSAIFNNNIIEMINFYMSGSADESCISFEVSTTEGRLIYVNKEWTNFFGDGGRANWADWRVQEHAVKLESHNSPPADFFIPFGAGWLTGPKRARIGDNRLTPGNVPYSRVFGYASNAVRIEGLSFVLSLYVEQTDIARDESDLHLSLQAASTLLNGIYHSREDSTHRLFQKSDQLRNVGGDFIFYRKPKNSDEKFDLCAVGDCTNKGMFAALQNALVGSALNRYVDTVSAKNWRADDVLAAIDDALCQLIRPENGAAAPTPPTPEHLALRDIGADAAAIIISHRSRTLHFASAQLPIYLVPHGQSGYGVEKIGDHGDGKNLGPARLKRSPSPEQPPQLTLFNDERSLGGVSFAIILTDGFEAALEFRQKQENLPSIEKLIGHIISSIQSPSAQSVGNALWEIYDQKKLNVSRRDDAALAVLDCSDV